MSNKKIAVIRRVVFFDVAQPAGIARPDLAGLAIGGGIGVLRDVDLIVPVCPWLRVFQVAGEAL